MEDNDRFAYMLKWLPQKFVPDQVIENLFGLRVESALSGYIRSWGAAMRRPPDIRNGEGYFNRHLFESFLQAMGLIPLKLAAARIGMDLDSFKRVLAYIEENRIAPLNPNLGKNIVEEALVDSIHKLLPQTRNLLFNNHSGRCQRIHEAIKQEWGIEINPLYCSTSQLIDDPADFAYEYDSLTGEPVGLRYQIWLNFKKPINLQPDVCSMKVYQEHQAELSRFLFGGERPKIPQALVGR